MAESSEKNQHEQKSQALGVESAGTGESGFRGSKAEALMALEYDRIPNVLKTPRAIRIQQKIATTVMIIVPLLLVAIAIGGGIDAYRDHQQSVQSRLASNRLEEAFQKDRTFDHKGE